MKREIFILPVIALIIFGVWQAFERTNPLDVRTAAILSTGGTETGDNATDFILGSLNGTDIRLGAFEGKKNLILHFWDKEGDELANLQAVRNFYGDRVEILGINGNTNISNIRKAAMDVTFPVLLDPGSEVKQAYGVSALPTTYFIDIEGLIVDKKEGKLTEQELNAKAKRLLAGVEK